MIFACCQPRRLEVLRRSGHANAIEFVEVLDHLAPPGVAPQRTLFVRLLHPVASLTEENIRIAGGERIPVVEVEWIASGAALPAFAEPGLVDSIDELPRTLVIRTKSSGDFSRYTLALATSAVDDAPPAGFDPLLSSIGFSFKVECPADFDCTVPVACAPAAELRPRIDYLAKDYAGFRRLMLDRLALLTPGWTERSAADLGVTLVELLAFAADTLSYRQDAVANEAYLHTARQRVSVRRHARLVDYALHEGCNARAFVHLRVARGGGAIVLPAGSRLLTRTAGAETVIASRDERAALAAGALVFETAHGTRLFESLNALQLYTWGDAGCCLPRGATRATLSGRVEHLAAGDFLLLEEVLSPAAADPANVDRTHRHIVRLTKVAHEEDPSGRLFDDPPVDAPAPVTRIEWDASDALPFPLCISVLERPGEPISVARGNIVLVEHGETRIDEPLPIVPKAPAAYAAPLARNVGDCCRPPAPRFPPLRYRPFLPEAPLTHGFELAALLGVPMSDPGRWSASALRALDVRDAMPRVLALSGRLHGVVKPWTVRRDLLESSADATDCVVEVEDDGRARLRFGDGTHGRRPEAEMKFTATYRVGNGALGNVGADAIAHLVAGSPPAIESIRNPLPAFGGCDAEDMEAARRDAPHAFRTQERAVTAADYARAAERRRDVQRAAATFRWTGSWHTVFVTADRADGSPVDAPFETNLRRHLEPFRMAGYDLEVDAPRFVPLDLSLHICVRPGYLRSDVLGVVRAVLSSSRLPDGRLGEFHPDNFTFGQPVYASRIVAVAQAVEGVEAVRVDRFQRLADPSPSTLANGVIPIGRLEIAQLENNPNFRDRGRLALSAGGGQ